MPSHEKTQDVVITYGEILVLIPRPLGQYENGSINENKIPDIPYNRKLFISNWSI